MQLDWDISSFSMTLQIPCFLDKKYLIFDIAISFSLPLIYYPRVWIEVDRNWNWFRGEHLNRGQYCILICEPLRLLSGWNLFVIQSCQKWLTHIIPALPSEGIPMQCFEAIWRMERRFVRCKAQTYCPSDIGENSRSQNVSRELA